VKFLVGRVDEIPAGSRKIVRIAGRSVGVFNVDGEFYAIRNRCPHQGAPLCEGKLWGVLSADVPGVFRYSAHKEILTCVWHGWEFDLKTGQSWCDPRRLRVRSYTVNVDASTELPTDLPVAAADRVKNRMIETANPSPVEAVIGPRPPELPDAPPEPGMLRGPYTVPTYQTVVDDGYLYLTVELSDLLAAH
jgi:3-phenylpropionate/trans-cinnamate dioxygenase ferredoxin subunit